MPGNSVPDRLNTKQLQTGKQNSALGGP